MDSNKMNDLFNKYMDTDVVCHISSMSDPCDTGETVWGCGFVNDTNGVLEIEMVYVNESDMGKFTKGLDEFQIDYDVD
jgi:hypothetical protein